MSNKLHQMETAQLLDLEFGEPQLLATIAFLLGEGKDAIANSLSRQLLSAIHIVTESQRLILEAQRQLLQLKRCACSSAIRQNCVCTEANIWGLVQVTEFANKLMALQSAITLNQTGVELLEQRHEAMQPLLQTIEQWQCSLCSEKELDLIWQSYCAAADNFHH